MMDSRSNVDQIQKSTLISGPKLYKTQPLAKAFYYYSSDFQPDTNPTHSTDSNKQFAIKSQFTWLLIAYELPEALIIRRLWLPTNKFTKSRILDNLPFSCLRFGLSNCWRSNISTASNSKCQRKMATRFIWIPVGTTLWPLAIKM